MPIDQDFIPVSNQPLLARLIQGVEVAFEAHGHELGREALRRGLSERKAFGKGGFQELQRLQKRRVGASGAQMERQKDRAEMAFQLPRLLLHLRPLQRCLVDVRCGTDIVGDLVDLAAVENRKRPIPHGLERGGGGNLI